ncbi:hypothetical protein PMAC_002697 [Pneumocystis sp. 'macacae']|nr:hypothetical protein PMAC_002697 [Pneumocystis sp. 'macacae']
MDIEKATEKLEEIKYQLILELEKKHFQNASLNYNKKDFISLVEKVKTGQYKAIQSARRWQQEYITTKEHMMLFSKYLAALSATMTTFTNRLFILYLVNDILSHCFANDRRDLILAMQSFLLMLLRLGYYISNAEKDKIEDLLNLWSEKKYFSEITMKATRAGLMVPPAEQPSESNSIDNVAKTQNYVKPSQHGRQGASYWELPAACMIPHLPDASIIKESMQSYISIPSHLCQPITLPNHTSSEILDALDSFYKQENMDLWGFKEKSDTENEDIDYEGWSKKFWAEKKQKDQQRKMSIHYERGRKTKRSESLSSRSSRSRKESSLISSRSYLSPSCSRIRSRTRSGTCSRSRSRTRSRTRSRSCSSTYSRSCSRTYSRSHSRTYSRSRSRTYSRSRSRSLSPRFQKSDFYQHQNTKLNYEEQDDKTFYTAPQTSPILSLEHSATLSSQNEQQIKQTEYSGSQRTREIAIKRGWKVR